MGISDITSGLLEGVGISSGRFRGCPAVRSWKRVLRRRGGSISCRVEGAGEKSFFFALNFGFRQRYGGHDVKFPPLFLNLLNHPLRAPPNRHNVQFVFSVLPHSRYSSNLATMNFVVYRESCILE